MKKIVIAIDSFKGCLTSAEAGEAAEVRHPLKESMAITIFFMNLL